jgi:pyruvate-formate lyase-activating enzyme
MTTPQHFNNKTEIAERNKVPDIIGHDWAGKERSVLVFNYTMACPLRCDFCCYGCNPDRKEKMSVDLALRLVREAAELNVFSSVGFTGGEALIHYDEVVEIAKELKKHKLEFTIATSAFWGKTKSEAEQILETLKSLGLKRLNVSSDPSHEKFVNKDFVLNAAEAASSLEISTHIIGTFHSAEDTLEGYIPSLIGLPFVRLHTKWVARVGRASANNITQAKYGIDLSLGDLTCYRRFHHDMVVWWDGSVYPCCSTFNRATDGLIFGNVNKESLRDIWYRIDGSVLLKIIKRQGFAELYKIIEQRNPALAEALPKVEDCAGPCSLCNKVLSGKLGQEVKEELSAYEEDLVLASLSKLTNLIEEAVLKRALTECLSSG